MSAKLLSKAFIVAVLANIVGSFLYDLLKKMFPTRSRGGVMPA